MRARRVEEWNSLAEWGFLWPLLAGFTGKKSRSLRVGGCHVRERVESDNGCCAARARGFHQANVAANYMV